MLAVNINNPGRLLLEVLSSKLQLYGHTAVAYMCCKRYDVTIQALIDRKHEPLVGRTLSSQSLALSSYTEWCLVIWNGLTNIK